MRTGEARTAAGVVLAATNLAQILVPIEQRSRVMPAEAIAAFSTQIMRAVREDREVKAVIGDVTVRVHLAVNGATQ